MIRQVRDVALRAPVMVQPEVTVLVAEQLLIAGHASVLYIVDANETLLGSVADQEILNYRLMGGDGRALIASLMTPVTTVLESTDPVERGFELLKQQMEQSLPVVQQGRMIGQLCRWDLLKLLTEAKLDVGSNLLPNLEPDLLSMSFGRTNRPAWNPGTDLRGVG